MRNTTIELGDLAFANDRPMALFGGMNVLESRDIALRVAEAYAEVTGKLGMPWVFKASFDKANRTSASSFRGPGLEEGLAILEAVKKEFGVPVLTDVHEDTPIDEVASVVDRERRPPERFEPEVSLHDNCAADGTRKQRDPPAQHHLRWRRQRQGAGRRRATSDVEFRGVRLRRG